MDNEERKKLHLTFHGRIIDSLGIQMYQSPVAAVAELIANAWDADATEVAVLLPGDSTQTTDLVVQDNGGGMTFLECQDRYLNVGRNRRITDGQSSDGGRPLLGRKGIGKFAGFGIARVVEIETVSRATGERTVFSLDLNELRSDEFIGKEREIDVLAAEGPDEERKSTSGTTIRLKFLISSRRPSADSFRKSMARRFTLAKQAASFCVTVNGEALPDEADPIANRIQYAFPTSYTNDEKAEGLTITSEGWGREEVGPGQVIEWQIKFTEKPIGEEELRGVAIYCGVKLAQSSFFFLLSGGLAGQHGQQYLTGRVRADYLDRLETDIITTERQRINWEDDDAASLLEWGKTRVKELLALWQKRRAEEKTNAIEGRLAGFSRRIAKLEPSEAKLSSERCFVLPESQRLTKRNSRTSRARY